MTTIEGVKRPSPMRVKGAIRFALGGVFGAAIGLAFVKLGLALKVPVKSFEWADVLALATGLFCIGVGGITYLISFNRRELAENLEGEDARLEATPDEVKTVRLQSAAILLAGVMLLIPLVAMGNGALVPGGAATLYGVIVVLFAVQTAVNVAVWRVSDEFLRQQTLIAGRLTFAIGQGALFLWAAAEHLHLARPLSSWQTINLLLAIYLLTASYLGIRARRKG